MISLFLIIVSESKMAMNFIAKAPANFLRFAQPRLATAGRYAKVILL